jgi:hypothetical protein
MNRRLQNVNRAKHIIVPVDKMHSFLLAEQAICVIEVKFLRGHATKKAE